MVLPLPLPGFVQAPGQGLCRLSARVCAGSWPGTAYLVLFWTTSTGSTLSTHNNRRTISSEVGDQARSRRFMTSTVFIAWPLLTLKKHSDGQAALQIRSNGQAARAGTVAQLVSHLNCTPTTYTLHNPSCPARSRSCWRQPARSWCPSSHNFGGRAAGALSRISHTLSLTSCPAGTCGCWRRRAQS